ncbi:MAG: STAS domain-containing protein [Halanaerobacter sp.]
MIELIEKAKDKVVVKLRANNLNRINANQFKEELTAILDEYDNFIIDLSNIRTIDCFAFGKILLFNEELESKSGKLKIINVESEYLRTVFSLLKNDLKLCL